MIKVQMSRLFLALILFFGVFSNILLAQEELQCSECIAAKVSGTETLKKWCFGSTQ